MNRIVHVELSEANDFVTRHHRHHKPVTGHRFSIGLVDGDGQLIGVAIVGRPVARNTDQKNTLEVLRLCTNGEKNACSQLYAAAARAGYELGYRVIQTSILDSEPGTSLRASGWEFAGRSRGGNWNSKSHPHRRTDQPMCPKQKWNRRLRPDA